MSHTRIRFGSTGLQVSPICFGTWQLSPRFWGTQDEAQVIDAMRAAFDAGVNFIDTAGAYGDGYAEQVVGRAVAQLPRDQVVIATKVFWHFHPDGHRFPDLSRQYILQYCDESLARMKLSHIDLLLCHSWDPLTPADEQAEALDRLVQQGRIRAYGVSNWNAEQHRYGLSAGGKFAANQPSYSLLNREIEDNLLPFCQANDIGVMVYSSLALGLLSGKYKGDETFSDLRKNRADFTGERFKTICDRVAKVTELARQLGMSTVQLVLAATLMHPGIHCAIVGIKSTSQILDAAGAMTKTLSREQWYAVRDLLRV